MQLGVLTRDIFTSTDKMEVLKLHPFLLALYRNVQVSIIYVHVCVCK